MGINDTTANFSHAHGLDFRGVDPEVVGFARPIKSSSPVRGARFGWLISPRPGKELTWSVPLEQTQLGAVVALPSWWRSALLQICVRFVPQSSIADVMEDTFWNHPNQCRVEVIWLPGSSADVSRRLGMDVLTTPYMETWEIPPVVYAGLTGEPTHLLITGERLWRNTVVTLGGQKADQIEVLPDMVGIAATFRCIRMPTTAPMPSTPSANGGPDGALDGTAARDPKSGGAASANADQAALPLLPPEIAYSAPVIVWTSEGHTAPQPATVIWRRNTQPCPSLSTEAGTSAGAAQQRQKESPVKNPESVEAPGKTLSVK